MTQSKAPRNRDNTAGLYDEEQDYPKGGSLTKVLKGGEVFVQIITRLLQTVNSKTRAVCHSVKHCKTGTMRLERTTKSKTTSPGGKQLHQSRKGGEVHWHSQGGHRDRAPPPSNPPLYYV